MSLADLPKVLIAHLTEYMDFNDVCNLMETSKKNYNAIKEYKKNKITVKELTFSQSYRGVMKYDAVDFSDKKFLFKDWNETASGTEDIEKVLQKCSSIDKLNVYLDDSFNRNFFNEIMKTKTKIRTVRIEASEYTISVAEILTLCRKLPVTFLLMYDGGAVLLNDEVLTKILPTSTVCKDSRDVIGNVTIPMPISDRSFELLIGEHDVQKSFTIYQVHNYITVDAVVKAMKILQERNGGCLFWHLGILRRQQGADAQRYFGENGEMRRTCDVDVMPNYETLNYIVVDRSGNFRIVFAIA